MANLAGAPLQPSQPLWPLGAAIECCQCGCQMSSPPFVKDPGLSQHSEIFFIPESSMAESAV